MNPETPEIVSADVTVKAGRAANLGCFKSNSLYSAPRNDSVVVHFLKKPEGMQYVWETLRSSKSHNPARCKRMSGVD